MASGNDLRVGFIGLGNMGAPMARLINAAGFPLTVFDVDRARATALAAELGCAAPERLAELAATSDVVITMLPNGRIVRAVAMGGGQDDDCLLPGLASGATLIDMSSSAPVGTRQLGSDLTTHGISMLDAPVSGGVKKAVSGTLAIMVGGDADLLERCAPVLSTMGRCFHVGPLGSGHAAKALNNMVSAAGLAAAAEALVVAQTFGVEPATLVEVLNASTGRNNSTENKFTQYIINEAFNSGFSLDLMVKDLNLAVELAEACQVPAELSHACLKLWKDAQVVVGQGADHTEIARYVRSQKTRA